MEATGQRLLPLIQQARGRCHACSNCKSYDLPTGSRFFCRAYAAEMTHPEREEVRGCPRWAPFRATDGLGRSRRADRNPLFARILAAEDELFWQLKHHLDSLGVDLKSVLVLAQPSIASAEEVAWVDTLDKRFGSSEPKEDFTEILDDLRELRYDAVVDVIDGLLTKSQEDVAA